MNYKDANQLIVWCGDSWTAGYGLPLSTQKRDRFSTLVGERLNVDTINLSQSGSSIGHLVYKLNQVLTIQKIFKNKKILVLFGLTVPSRLCITPEFGKKITVGVNDFDILSYHKWAKDIFNNRHIINETCIKISWIVDQCRKYNINFKFYNILCNFDDFSNSSFKKYLTPSDWLISSSWSTYSELFDITNLNFDKMAVLEKTSFGKSRINEYFIPNDHHPNQAGHIKIANTLSSSIAIQINKS